MVARRRIPLLGLGALSLMAGLLAGEARLGWPVPDRAVDLALLHGPLMICAFLGTVIGLERAVALGRRWGYAAPLLSGGGGIALILGAPGMTGALLITAASLVFLALAGVVLTRQMAPFTLVMGAGAAAWSSGTLLWLLGWPLPAVVPLWACFLVLTIAGERLELSRFLPPARDRAVTLPVPLLLLLGAAVAAVAEAAWAGHAFGGGLLVLALWLLRHDIARRTIRQTGLTRYMAVCLLSGYGWLAVAGLMALLSGLPAGGLVYDGVLHALFVGFVFAMIFGHAPVILPAVLRVTVPFHGVFYGLLALLHLSVAIRLAGDLMPADGLRSLGGLMNGLAILAFIVTAATLTLRHRRTATVAPANQGITTSDRGNLP